MPDVLRFQLLSGLIIDNGLPPHVLQDIMLVAKNAKSHVYEICLHLLKVVDKVKSEEIKSTTVYHKLNKENSELLRRYCFYLKLKIMQL